MADFKKSMEMLGRIVDLNRPPAPQRIIRASDAFSPFIDKSVGVTMADRTKAEQFGKFKGGARFPWLQNVDPAYEGQTWGFGKKGMATRMHGQFEAIPEEELLISTILGKKDMLKSNPEVFADLVKQYKKGMKSGLLTDELRVKTNKALAGIPADDTGKLMFGPDVDIADPAFFKSLDTFDKRREVGNILGGVGVGGKKGQLFDYDAAIKKYTEPSLHEAPNMSIGPRIFTLSGTKAERPDLNAAYPHVVGGLDLGVDYTPVPRNIFLKDYHDDFMSRGKVPGWYNITQSSSMPYQKITDEWLQHLKDRGYAEGGEVEHMQAGGIKKAIGALEELTQAAPKKITHSMLRRRGMGISSKDEADALYSSGHRIFGMHEMDEIPFEITDRALFDNYAPDLLMAYPPEHLLKKASGGDVEHMQSGGIKKAVGTMLSAAERDANLAKYMEGAAIPDRLYHATTATQGGKGNEALRNLKPSKEGALGSGIYMTPSTDYANMYAQGEGGNVMPLFTNMRNPLKITGEHRDPMKEALIKLGVDPAKADTMVERAYETNGYIGKQVRSRAQAQGFDGIAQYKDGDLSEVVAFNPNSVKSAIGNTGEYMPYSGLLGKAEGGSVEHMQMGGLKGMVGAGAKVLTKAERDANLTKFLEDSALKQRLYHGSKQMRFNPDGSRVYAPDEGYKELLPSGTGELNSALNTRPPAVFLSPNPEFANQFATSQVNNATPAVYPVHAKIKNPFDYANQAHMDALEREYIKTHIDSRLPAEGESLFDFKKANAALANDLRRSLESAKSHDANWNTLEDMKIQEIIRKLGHDAFYVTENGVKNIGVYDPKMIKSATGNQGTYDITTTELNKASGGVAHMQAGGLKNLVSGATKVLSQAERDAKLVKFLEGSKISDRIYRGNTEDIISYDKNKLGSNPDTAHQTSQLGFFLTKSPDEASAYAGREEGANVQPLHAAIKNPYETTWENIREVDGYELQQKLKSLGYDGVVIRDAGMPDNYVAFEPTQVKSAIGNQGTYDVTNPDITKAHGGQVEHMQAGGLKTGVGLILPEVENAIAGIKEANRMPVVPMPNRWFLQPEKFPQMQGMVEKVLQRSGLPRESFTSGAYVNPITGDILDRKIFEDVGVAINPQTNRPMMSAGKEAGIEELEKELGGMTRSNLVRKGLFKRTGGDSLLDDINFLATIERSGMGHKYGLSTEYGSPTQMFNTGKSGNPTLRPTSRGDVFGVGDVVGQIQLGKGPMHDVYEKLFVAPQGMDVPGVKLHKGDGGMAKTPVGGEMKHTSFQELREEMGMADGGDIMHKLVKYAAAGGEIDDLQHSMAKQYLETLNG